MSPNRILLYVHYNKYDELADYVIYQLEKLRPLYNRVVFISNSVLPYDAKSRLGGLVDKIMQRENKGFDFAAWRDGMLKEGWEALEKYDWLTIMNDTCFGPVYELEPIYKKMENSGADFWGMTEHGEIEAPNNPIATNDVIGYHIMSYFISFNAKSVRSKVFRDFWESVQDYINVHDVIKNYETRFTSHLLNAGLKGIAMIPSDGLEVIEENATIFRPEEVLKAKMPFVKIKAFVTPNISDYAMNVLLLLLLLQDIGYNTRLIIDYLVSNYQCDENYLIQQNLIRSYSTINQISVAQKLTIGIHIHVYYVEILQEILEELQEIHVKCSLFITTDSQNKVNEIRQIVTNYSFKETEVEVVDNLGRDILPWIKTMKKLERYDIAAHFHTKKSFLAHRYTGKMWRESIYYALIKDAQRKILPEFEKDKKLGIIIPDVPQNFHYYNQPTILNDKAMYPELNKLWKELVCKKDIDFAKKSALLFPYGSMIWYRPKALKKVSDIKIDSKDITEPLKQGSILHMLERLLVYLAWDEGYTYRISQTEYVSGFIDSISYNNIMQREFNSRGGLFVQFIKSHRILHFIAKFIRNPIAMTKHMFVRVTNKLSRFLNISQPPSIHKDPPPPPFLTSEIRNELSYSDVRFDLVYLDNDEDD